MPKVVTDQFISQASESEGRIFEVARMDATPVYKVNATRAADPFRVHFLELAGGAEAVQLPLAVGTSASDRQWFWPGSPSLRPRWFFGHELIT